MNKCLDRGQPNDLNIYKTAGNRQNRGQCCGGEASNLCCDKSSSCRNWGDSTVGHGLDLPEVDCGQIDFNKRTGMCLLAQTIASLADSCIKVFKVYAVKT